MTTWLCNRLVMWGAASLLSGAFLWNSGALQAQTYFKTYWDAKHPRLKLSKAQASLKFAEYISVRAKATETYTGYYPAPEFGEKRRSELESERLILESVSLKSLRELNYDVRLVLDALAKQWSQEKHTVVTQDGGKTTLSIPTQPLVLIQENGGWVVDLIETYATWNKLQGTKKLEAIAKLTGARLTGLPNAPEANRSYCASNMAKLAIALIQYSQDYDERYPLARNWEDSLDIYAGSRALFHCPGLPRGKSRGFAFNRYLASRDLNAIDDTPRTVELYETSALKPNMKGNGENAAFRHGNGANYAFADGHVKWFAKGNRALRFGVGP